MIDVSMNLTRQNRLAEKERDKFRSDLATGNAGLADFQTLKHKFPYIGFVACRADEISFLMFHCNDDVVVWQYFWRGDDAYEPGIVKRWIEWSKTSRKVLDIGAYTGMMSILAAQSNPECVVHAFEPVERTVERMKINVCANGLSDRIVIHPRAAAAEFGVEMINHYRDENFLGPGNSIHDKGRKAFARRLIQTVNVDQFLGGEHRFDLVKIDVEGFEPHVLMGLQTIILRDRPRLVLEVWEENRTDVFRLLDAYGYLYEPVEKVPARVMNYLCEPKRASSGNG